jgi:galactose mutarotase-like enzyme
MTMLLSGRVLEVTLTAKNVGTVPEPMGIGWQPRFVVPSGERDQVRLQVPAPDRVEVSTGEGRTGREAGLPTGRLVSVDGTPYDLRADGGKTLPRGDFNVTYTNLKTGFLDGGPIVEMVDPASNYGLRITALTPRIKSFHVTSPASGEFISISPQYNMDDPLGHEWPKTQDTGMMVLLPGEKAEWKVRVELFDPSTEGKPAQLSHRDSTRRNLPIQPSAQDPIERGEKPGN